MSNVKTNDQKILELKKQIEEKKKALAKSQKFSPITNCSIEIDGQRYNLQVLNKEQLITLLVKLNSYAMSAENLKLLEEYFITGYNVLDWIKDIKAKIAYLSRKEEENKLKAMEYKLNQLLSNEKKVELELNEIASFLD